MKSVTLSINIKSMFMYKVGHSKKSAKYEDSIFLK